MPFEIRNNQSFGVLASFRTTIQRLTTIERNAAVDAAHRFAATTALGVSINLTLFEHLSAAIATEEDHIAPYMCGAASWLCLDGLL